MGTDRRGRRPGRRARRLGELAGARPRGILGGQGLANLNDPGTQQWHLHPAGAGPPRPGCASGPVERLAGPSTMLSLTAALDRRRADIRLRASSRAAAVAAEGLVDLGRNRFEESARRRPPHRARRYRARSVRPRRADRVDPRTAPSRRPRVAYDLRAGQPHHGRRRRSRGCAPWARRGSMRTTSSFPSPPGRAGSWVSMHCRRRHHHQCACWTANSASPAQGWCRTICGCSADRDRRHPGARLRSLARPLSRRGQRAM